MLNVAAQTLRQLRGSSHQLQPSLCEVFGVLVHRDGPYRHAAAVRNGRPFELPLDIVCPKPVLVPRVGFHQKKAEKSNVSRTFAERSRRGRGRAHALSEKTLVVLSFPLRFSQACLGKAAHFTIKLAENGVFSPDSTTPNACTVLLSWRGSPG
jgi:hypothetical protein